MLAKRIFIPLAMLSLSLSACDPMTRSSPPDECVVLLHGLSRTSMSMVLRGWSLEDRGYRIANIDYPSREHPIEALENGVDNLHEDAGADYLAPWFPPAVTEPIRLHVAAKRYLCAVDTGYYGQLSDASVHSLKVQGGPMTADEIRRFEANPNHRDALRLRRYDDDGKVSGLSIKPVTDYRPLLESLLRQ